jgi:hypothetical protein
MTDKLLDNIGTFFVFDLSPFMVKIDNDRMPLTHFLVKICAIIGGVVSVGSRSPWSPRCCSSLEVLTLTPLSSDRRLHRLVHVQLAARPARRSGPRVQVRLEPAMR